MDSLVDSKINIFENFVYNTIEELQEEELFGDITFYLISNIDIDSNIDILHISEKNMRFINHVAPKFFKSKLTTTAKDEWNNLVFKYSSKDAQGRYRVRTEPKKALDKKLKIWVDAKNSSGQPKKEKIKFEEDVIEKKNYKATIKYFNPLINSFIQGKSILGFLKQSKASWNLTKIYLKEIKDMREERLNVIKQIADKLQLFNNEGDNTFYKKIVRPIEMTKSQTEFRENLRILMRKFLSKSDEPLFTADEMVLYILPSGESWNETKDILLIALYEKMNLKEEDIENLNQAIL